MPVPPKTWTAKKKDEVRIDHFLVDQFPAVSRKYLQDLIVEGQVTVNGKTVRKGYVLTLGDVVQTSTFILPEERRIRPNNNILLDVVFESEDVAVVDKPPGLPTHPNDFEDEKTLANAALARFPQIQSVGEDPLRPGIVHRLDTDTSGLILIAKTEKAFRDLRRQFDERLVKKTYLALVLGEVTKEGSINFPLAHHATNPRRMVAVREGVTGRSRIREAQTLYKPIKRYGAYTLLEVKTLTGRMHQVRVHLSAIGHSLVGDRVYQSKKEQSADGTGLKRHFLHAAELIFMKPNSTDTVRLASDLPIDLQDCLSRISGE